MDPTAPVHTPTKEVELAAIIIKAQSYVWRRITLFRALAPKPWNGAAKIWHAEMCEVHGILKKGFDGLPQEIRSDAFALCLAQDALVFRRPRKSGKRVVV